MSDALSPSTQPPATDADGKLLLGPDAARALLRECCTQFQVSLLEVLTTSIEGTDDLFEDAKFDERKLVSDDDVLEFRTKRPEWLKRFAQAHKELFDRRIAGDRRRGRRPDADRSLASLRVLNAYDQEKQAALVYGAEFLRRLTRREVDALDLRVGVLLGEKLTRDIDNPFAPDYVLDAIGMTSRALLPNPRIWRPFMERLLADITPAATKTYIKLNRLLADRHVLPEIKAELRARSELRPVDDRDLLPLFNRLIKEISPPDLALNVAVPQASPGTGALPSPGIAGPAPRRAGGVPPAAPKGPVAVVSAAPPAEANPYVAELSQAPPTAPGAQTNAFGLPQVDPLLALGSLSAVVAALDRWQLRDPGAAVAADAQQLSAAAAELGASAVNRIPWIRAAVADQVVNPTDKITIDVIALLFDYIFRDPSIPETLRRLFERLEVPILKAALIDRTFFSDKKHPARKLLDHLASAAIGATSDEGYRAGFELVATGVIDEVCRDFKVDVAVFAAADARLQEFIETEQRKAAALLDHDVAAALIAEQSEAERSQVRALIRDKLTGISVPFEVRGFAETIWADYLTLVRKRDGVESGAWNDGVRILDDLLWSITAKERNAQKARLAKMVPAMIRGLRAGGAAVQARDERLQPFLEAVYKLHIAAIKPKAEVVAVATREAAAAAVVAAAEATADAVPTLTAIANVHDFVNDMVVGTWLAFDNEGKTINARLSWVSPLRTKYIFTTRSRGRALAVSPEELAWQLSEGTTRLILEPVPLFDRAVSSALDELAAQKPAAAA
jgi:hypothetical protein